FVTSVPVPDLISGDSLYFNFQNFTPFSANAISVVLHVPNSPADSLHFNAFAQFDSSGNYYTLDSHPLNQMISCSSDPHDKSVSPEGVLADHYTLYNDTMFYTI